MEINYSYIAKTDIEVDEYFLIDVVDFTKFAEYLNKLHEKDIATLQKAIEYEPK